MQPPAPSVAERVFQAQVETLYRLAAASLHAEHGLNSGDANVAADALSNLASPGVIGGALIVVGEECLAAIDSLSDDDEALTAACVLDLAYGDTVSVTISASNGAKVVDVFGAGGTIYSWFSGAYL